MDRPGPLTNLAQSIKNSKKEFIVMQKQTKICKNNFIYLSRKILA